MALVTSFGTLTVKTSTNMPVTIILAIRICPAFVVWGSTLKAIRSITHIIGISAFVTITVGVGFTAAVNTLVYIVIVTGRIAQTDFPVLAVGVSRTGIFAITSVAFKNTYARLTVTIKLTRVPTAAIIILRCTWMFNSSIWGAFNGFISMKGTIGAFYNAG